MCRVLVSLADNTIIHAIEDDQEFGSLEGPPVFGVVEMPELPVAEFRKDLLATERAIHEQKEQEALTRATVKAQSELASVRDPDQAKRIIDNYFDRELSLSHVEIDYRLPALSAKQRLSLEAGRVTIPTDKVTRDQLFTQRVKETFREVR